jgi:S1-C subfamily serine protease
MNRYVFACTVSALIGALASLGLQESWLRREASAQQTRTLLDPDEITPQSDPLLIDDTDLDPQLRRQRSFVVTDDTAVYTPEERVNIAVYESANRSVVNITTKSSSPAMLSLLEVPTEGAGLGSVLDTSGHILTNDHVIEGASEVRVTLFNGETFRAGLVGRDAVNDMAVLRIDAPAKLLYPVKFGDSANLRVGQRVLAIGNPFGLERTMTQGILSSVNRTLASRTGRDMKSILQIDAALNRGNSGGPLLNTRG